MWRSATLQPRDCPLRAWHGVLLGHLLLLRRPKLTKALFMARSRRGLTITSSRPHAALLVTLFVQSLELVGSRVRGRFTLLQCEKLI